MKANLWKSLLQVLAALAVFYALSLAYFSPVLEGKQLIQGDIRNFQGMAQEIVEHRSMTGEDPLWTGSMFSGMPAYQISVVWSSNLLHYADAAFHGFLPRPASFLFLYLLGMYILMRCLRVDPWLSIVGAIAFGFSSYFFAILEAGHNSKANAIGYMPMVLGAVYVLYRGRMVLGSVLLALFMGLEVTMNHVQITYYLGIVLVLFILAEALRMIKAGAAMDFLKRSGLGLVAVALALACNFGLLWTTTEYGSYTTRGKSELTIQPDGSPADEVQTSGLDRDYVTQWSYGKQESFTLLVPNAKGGASGSMIQTMDDLRAIDDPAFRNALQQEYQSGYVNSYWGDQSFTSGPVYLGAIVVLLMLLALAQAEGFARWWVLASIPLIAIMLYITSPVIAGALLIAYLLAGLVLWKDTLAFALFGGLLVTLMLSWGHNYMPLTDFFLDHVPGYSKFRAVTIILVIVELVAPVLAVLYLDRLLKQRDSINFANLRFIVPAGVLLAVLLIFIAAPSAFFEFISDAERAKYNLRIDSGAATEDAVVAFVDGLKDYRIGVFRADAMRSLAFVLLGGGVIFLFIKRWLPKAGLLVALGVLLLIDQLTVDKRYVNNDKDKGRYLAWEDKKASQFPFEATIADKAILESEWSPQAEAYHKTVVAKLKADRAGERGTDRMVTKGEELIARFGSLRRNSDFRVLSLRDPFNDARVSYFHKSVGGYHGAKLKRYQELIAFQLAPGIMRLGEGLSKVNSQAGVDSVLAHEGVINMLNTRYLIYSNERPPLLNTNAFGSAWFVDELRFVKNADEEIKALGDIDPARTALVDERYRAELGDAQLTSDPSASVTLDNYATNELKYTVRSDKGGLVVFSAIWYGPDWQATLDGKPVAHVRADYVLRAMHVPPGEHKVVFKVEGHAYRTSQSISLGASILVLLLALGMAGLELKRAMHPRPGSVE